MKCEQGTKATIVDPSAPVGQQSETRRLSIPRLVLVGVRGSNLSLLSRFTKKGTTSQKACRPLYFIARSTFYLGNNFRDGRFGKVRGVLPPPEKDRVESGSGYPEPAV